MIRLKNAYDPPSPDDGFRVLVERFWPRDLDKRHAKLDLWLKEVAPDEGLHARFGEDPSPERFAEFERLYRDELNNKHKSIELLRQKSAEGVLTLVHRAHNPDRSSATVLKRYLETSGNVRETLWADHLRAVEQSQLPSVIRSVGVAEQPTARLCQAARLPSCPSKRRPAAPGATF